MRLAQRRLDLLRPLSPRKDEPQVAGALRERHNHMADGQRYVNFLDARDGLGLRQPFHALEQACARDRDHHHPTGTVLAL